MQPAIQNAKRPRDSRAGVAIGLDETVGRSGPGPDVDEPACDRRRQVRLDRALRLAIATVQQHHLKTLHEDREVTRLGESVFETGIISPEAMANSR